MSKVNTFRRRFPYLSAVFFLTVFAAIVVTGQTSEPLPMVTPSPTVTPSPVPTPDPDPTPTPKPNPEKKVVPPEAIAPTVPSDPQNPSDVDSANDSNNQKKKKRGSLILAPIPIKSPTFGGGIVIGVGYVFKVSEKDKISPPSTIGIATAFTASGSRGIGIVGSFRFLENKYQAKIAIGKGRARYDFFGVGRVIGGTARSVEIEQNGNIFFGEFLRNVGKNIFVGPRYQYRELTASIGGGTTPGGFVIPVIDLKSKTVALGFRVMRDLRDNSFYPTKGSVLDFKADFFSKALGSRREYRSFVGSYNAYHKIGKGQVFAYRGKACSVSDSAPFYDVCFFGGNDLRGYSTGRFQDRRMWVAQAEYRRELPWRMGLVGFAGVGGVARRWNEFRFKESLPAGGFGIRFKLDKTNHINYRVDFGFGRTGSTISVSLTEAF